MQQGAARMVPLAGAILGVLSLASCNQASLLHRFTAPQAETIALHDVDLLRQQHFQGLEAQVDSSVERPELRDRLEAMAKLFPAGAPLSVKVVSARSFHGNDATGESIILEYQFPRSWLLAEIDIVRKDSETTLSGFRVTPIPRSLEATNRFTMIGKSASQYAVLLLAIAAMTLSIYAFILCLRTRLRRSKWLWSIVCLVGATRLSINWTTGQIGFILLAVHLPPASAQAAFYGPWTISVALPIGAIVFLTLRDHLARSPEDLTPGAARTTI